jgi:hypothetical protein
MTARDAWGQVAHDLRILADSIDAAIEQPAAGGASAVPPQRSSAPAPLPPRRQAPDDSAFTECPAHHKPWKDGRFGKMCTATEPEGVPHDPDWYNDKGYCRVTPRSAGAWLRQHAA